MKQRLPDILCGKRTLVAGVVNLRPDPGERPRMVSRHVRVADFWEAGYLWLIPLLSVA